MKNQIEQLVKIALEFKQLGTEANLEQTHNTIQSPYCKILKGDREVVLYFANDFDVFSLKWGSSHLDKIEIAIYSGQIYLPYEIVTEDYLQKAVNDLILVLFNFKQWVNNNKLSADELKKQGQIASLKEQLAILENPDSKPLDNLDLPF